MTNYRSGYSLEYKAMQIFKQAGYEVDRRGASKPIDLSVKKNGITYYVCECKKTVKKNKDTIYLSKEDVEKVLKEAEKNNATPLIIVSWRFTPVYVLKTNELKKTHNFYRADKGSGRELKTFLEARK